MDMDPESDTDKGQKADLSLCIICQEKSDEKLVEKPSSHEKKNIGVDKGVGNIW